MLSGAGDEVKGQLSRMASGSTATTGSFSFEMGGGAAWAWIQRATAFEQAQLLCQVLP